MENCLGIITMGNMDKKESDFGPLCKNRPVYMLPFGGRYRLIDFTISNMVNQGINTVAVYTGDKVRSTMDHLGNGKPWDLNRRFNGLFLFPPLNDPLGRKGEVAELYSTLEFFTRAKEDNILLIHPNYIGSVDLSNAYEKFLQTDADITLFYTNKVDPWGEYINCNKIILNSDGEFKNIGVNLGTEQEFNMYIGMLLIKKEILLEILKKAMEDGETPYLKEAILSNKDKYDINTYEYNGHIEAITDLKSFYNANLNLLSRDISQEMFFKGGPIFTKAKDEPSTFYGENSNVKNSLVANGCIVEGTVENSILFRGVKVGKGAIIKNSILMQKSEIEENAIVVNVIMDKYSAIDKEVRIAGNSALPYVVSKSLELGKEQ